MNVKDKIIIGIMVILLVGAGYIQYNYFSIVDRMDVMESEQLKHIDDVNHEFRKDLEKLRLQFIGRGKHLRRAQEDIVINTDLIHSTADSLASLIDNLAFELDELDRSVQKRFNSVENDIRDIEDDFKSERRKNSRRFSDLDQLISTLRNELKEIEELSIIQKAKAKADKNK